jgi:acetyltransferase-like isoleucine patch superfamily enzyme
MSIFNHPQFRQDSEGALVSNSRIDGLIPNAIEVGENLISATGSWILSHDSSLINHIDKVAVKKTIIGNNVFIGLNAIIMPGIKVGDGSIVGAGAVVTRDVQPYTIVVGNPAKFICTVDEYIEKVKTNSILVDPIRDTYSLHEFNEFRQRWSDLNDQESESK